MMVSSRSWIVVSYREPRNSHWLARLPRTNSTAARSAALACCAIAAAERAQVDRPKIYFPVRVESATKSWDVVGFGPGRESTAAFVEPLPRVADTSAHDGREMARTCLNRHHATSLERAHGSCGRVGLAKCRCNSFRVGSPNGSTTGLAARSSGAQPRPIACPP